ncbi:MAG: ethanolamine transporter [Myxococcaceae bacterium]|nr:ethanolamine transporter [Myxococcaceae bacterium]
MTAAAETPALKRVLRPVHLWAIAVGLVISGDYFGWNYGLAQGGPVGLGVATLAVTVLYVCFIFSYTELSTAIPHAGGPFAFAQRAFGPWGAYLAGAATLLEFLFAPPAIARAIGSYVHFRVPALPVDAVAVGAFVVFGVVNAVGVSIAATFELVVTVLATFELGLFFFLTAPHVEAARLFARPLLPHGVAGVFAAVPFAIWFYLGLEGVAMSAEEVVDPRRTIPRGYLAGIATLVTLALGTLVCTCGVLPWSELVRDDSPLPHALARVLSPGHPMTHLMVYLGLLGLVASFHGIVMGCSRQVFALAREGLIPRALAAVHPRFNTPTRALALSCAVGAVATLSGRTDALITLSVLGALGVYLVSMAAVIKLRRSEPALERPFRAPLHPWLPLVAIALSTVAFVAVGVGSPAIVAVFLAVLAAGAVAFRGARKTPAAPS